jgi:hypothetical protein
MKRQDERKQIIAAAMPRHAAPLVYMWAITRKINLREFSELYPLIDAKCACEVCGGDRGGVPGNENIVGGVVMCDYCHADHI